MKTVDEEYQDLESVADMHEKEKRLAYLQQKCYDEFITSVELSMRDGNTRVFIREIFKWCGFYDVVNPEKEKVLHAEGRRLVGRQIKEILDSIDPTIYHELMLEGVKYEKALYGME